MSPDSPSSPLVYPLEALQFPRGKDVPLPNCEGPKLRPFRPYGRADIEWVRQVAVTEQSAVWKVKVEGDFYALKLFGFPLAGDPMRSVLGLEDLKLRADQLDHFSCECRAYGRLHETGHGDLVVRCHGYVLLTPEQEEQQRNLSYEHLWSMKRLSDYDGIPIRGIVKDWVEEGTPHFTHDQIRKIQSDIKIINSVGVINRDIRKANYLGGKLVDFGIAWTVPHFLITDWLELVAEGGEDAERWHSKLSAERERDQAMFDWMVDAWNESGQRPWIWLRNLPNDAYYLERLRPRNNDVQPVPFKGPDAISYDWKRATVVRDRSQRARHTRASQTAKDTKRETTRRTRQRQPGPPGNKVKKRDNRSTRRKKK